MIFDRPRELSPAGRARRVVRVVPVVASLLFVLPACASNPDSPFSNAGTGGAPASGGTGGSAGTLPGGAGAGAGGSSGATAGTPGVGGSAGVVETGGTAGVSGGTAGEGASGLTGGSAGTAGEIGAGGLSGAAGGAGDAGAAGLGAGGSAGGGGVSAGGSAGMSGSAGTAGAAGGGALGPDLTDVGPFTPATCTITPTVMTASAMPLVGVATFTTDLAGAERAIVQFGKTATYTLEAPVNWAEASHRTLILGMPANTDVHYRVVVFQGSTACIGPDATYHTGENVSGAPGNQTPTKGTSSASPAPGFIIAENGNFSYIIDNQGEVVWAHRFPISLTRSLMSWDGMYMYGRDVGPFNASSGGNVYRVAMDGSGETKLSLNGGTHHDLVAIPTGIAYPAKQTAGACDCIYTAGPDGSGSKCLVDLDIVFGKFAIGPGGQAMEKCHVNAIRYYKDTQSYSVSDREKDAIAFISSTGEVLGSIGATPTGTTPNHAKAEGADSTTSSTWRVQHGHDQYEPHKIVLWSNGNFSGGSSKVLHYTINGSTATLDWQYTATGNSPTFSDAQHLPNGNFLATNSGSGAVHEFDATQKLVQSFSALSRGYSCHRPTLYGPPPGR